MTMYILITNNVKQNKHTIFKGHCDKNLKISLSFRTIISLVEIWTKTNQPSKPKTKL